MQKSDWKKCKLGDTAIEIIDGDRGKQYPKNNELLPDGFCLFLSTKNLPDIHFDFSETQFISKEKDCALRKGKLQRNDIAFTTRGTLGHLAWFTDAIPYDNIRINSGMVILRNQDCGIDTRFLFQQLASQYIQKQIAELRTGSAQPQLPIKDFLNLELYLPPLEEQKRIANILGALDDKIELLQKQNKTLEEMANLKVRFFLKQTAVKTRLLSEISSIKYGKGISTKQLTPTGYKVFGGNGIIGHYSSFMYDLPQILVSCRGAASGNIWESYPKSFITSNSLVIELEDRKYYEFIKRYLKLNPLHQYATGSAQPQITIDNLKQVRVPYPDFDQIDDLTKDLLLWSKKIYQNILEQETLTELRDALLPRLISGKLRV